jgi:CheY-like chemotaxis protein
MDLDSAAENKDLASRLVGAPKPLEPRQHPANRSVRVLIIAEVPSIHQAFNAALLEEGNGGEQGTAQPGFHGQKPLSPSLRATYALDHAFSELEATNRVRRSLAEGRRYQIAFADSPLAGSEAVETLERLSQIDANLQGVICLAEAAVAREDLIRRPGRTDKIFMLRKPFARLEVVQLARLLCGQSYLAQPVLPRESMGFRDRPTELPALAPAPDFAPPGNQPLILVVENNADRLSLFLQALRPQYRVVAAENAELGLAKAQQTVPDLILADAFPLPLDGTELCRRLHSIEATSPIPFILLSASGRETDHAQALAAGVDDYVCEPFSLPLLVVRVHNLLESRRRLRERFRQEITLQPRGIAVTPVEAQFLRRIVDAVEKHLSDSGFNIDDLARNLSLSRRQLFRKFKALTGQTPHAFLRAARLTRAAQLLRESQMTIMEITFAVGFDDLKHFRTVFREHFGVLPSEYARNPADPA